MTSPFHFADLVGEVHMETVMALYGGVRLNQSKQQALFSMGVF